MVWEKKTRKRLKTEKKVWNPSQQTLRRKGLPRHWKTTVVFITFHVAGDVVMLNMTILRERVPLACSFRGNSSSWQQGVAADHSAPIVRKQNEQKVEPDSTTSRSATPQWPTFWSKALSPEGSATFANFSTSWRICIQTRLCRDILKPHHTSNTEVPLV